MYSPIRSEIRYFFVLAQTRNISRAAEILGINQPSLSKALSRMEDDWGARLFSRSKKGIELTAEGHRALRVLNDLQSTWDSSWKTDDRNSVLGKLSLGAHLSIVQTIFHSFYPRLLSRFPAVNIELTYDRSYTVTRKVIHAELDMGIVINPQRHPELVIKSLRKEFVGLWRGHKLREQPEVIYFNPEMINVYQFLKMFSEYRQIPVVDYLAIGSLLRAGNAMAILPSSTQEIFPDLVVEKTLMPAQLSLIYRKDRSQNLVMQKITAEIRKCFL